MRFEIVLNHIFQIKDIIAAIVMLPNLVTRVWHENLLMLLSYTIHWNCECLGYEKRTFVEVSEHSDVRSPNLFRNSQNIVAIFGALHSQCDNSVYLDHQTHLYYPLFKKPFNNDLCLEICLRFRTCLKFPNVLKVVQTFVCSFSTLLSRGGS